MDNLTEEVRKRLLQYRDYPAAFAKDVFGVSLDPWQIKAANALAVNQKVAIAGCTGVGKDFLAAILVWWFLSTHNYPKVICTAVKKETLTDNLWGELSLMQRKSRLIAMMFNYGATKISAKGAEEEWFAVARTASKRYSSGGGNAQAEGLAGKYAEDTLAVVDEACFSADTEVLTDQGWMLFKKIKRCKTPPRIFSFDPKKLEGRYCDYTEYHEYDYSGKMYSHDTDKLNFKVTPKHKIFCRDPEVGNYYEFVRAKDIDSEKLDIPTSYQYGEYPEYVTISTNDITREEYNGKVYCLTVPPFHLLYTRRNGKCMWSGNSGVDDSNFDALEGSANTPRRKMLVIGNPLRRTGRFAQIYLDKRFGQGWYKQNVSYLESTRTSGTPEVRAIREKWIEMYGEKSAYVQARVFGQFPQSSTDDTIFTREELQFAQSREVELDSDVPICIGVDVARFGADETVYYVRRGMKSLEMVCESKTDGNDVVGRVVDLAHRWCLDGEDPKTVVEVRVDETGLGGMGVVDPLEEQGWKVVGVHNGSGPTMRDDYFNLAAELWMEDAKEAIQSCSIIDDEILANQLETRQYKFTGKSRQRRLMSKDEMRRNGMGSPDRGDAFVLAFADATKIGLGIANLKDSISFF